MGSECWLNGRSALSTVVSSQEPDSVPHGSLPPHQHPTDASEDPDASHQHSYFDAGGGSGGGEDDVSSGGEPVVQESVVSDSSPETANTTSEVKNTSAVLVACTVVQDAVVQPVELANSTRLMSMLSINPNITTRRTPANCAIVLFYARYCPFSSMAAPHFNALPRAYPSIRMVAVDAMKFHSFNTQYGIVGVPTLMLFHNGRPAAKFNESAYTLEAFSKFVNKYTGLEPQGLLFVKSSDFIGPVSSVPTKETDYCLVLSWMFIAACAVYVFGKSSWWRWIVEAVQNTWRESEAQHEHDD